MSSRQQYLIKETLISVAINTGLSIGFVFLAFHGRSRIMLNGAHGIIVDMVPQTFMVTLMSCLVPGLLTSSRHAAGKLGWHQHAVSRSVLHIWLRAPAVALLATCVVVASSWLSFPHIIPGGLTFRELLISKAIFGMTLATLVTPWAILGVLGQGTLQAKGS